MPSHDISRFVLLIASIADRSRESDNAAVSFKCFLFEIDDKTEECLPFFAWKVSGVNGGGNRLDASLRFT